MPAAPHVPAAFSPTPCALRCDLTRAFDRCAPHAASYTDAKGISILFETSDCLCEDPADCKAENTTLYQITHSGLDRMVEEYLLFGEYIQNFTKLDPYLNGPEYL